MINIFDLNDDFYSSKDAIKKWKKKAIKMITKILYSEKRNLETQQEVNKQHN